MSFPLPGFELAPPQAIDPKFLVRSQSDALGALMLCLALAYNDLKDAEYALHGLNERRLAAESGTVAQLGQFAGMMHHVGRSMCAVVHEVLVLLNDKRRLVATEDFQKYVKRLHRHLAIGLQCSSGQRAAARHIVCAAHARSKQSRGPLRAGRAG